MQRLQSWLFVPGHRQSMIDKAHSLGADALILDLEDGVPPAEKETARAQIAATLPNATAVPFFVRTHPTSHAELTNDLEAIVGPGLTGLVLPKVNAPEDIISLSAALAERERQAGMPTGQTQILALVETARGLIQAPAIAAASPRMAGLLFGAEDFALDTHADAMDDFLYARSALVIAAASSGIQAIDRAHLDLHDTHGLSASTCQARRLGFTGRLLVHPRQITAVHDAFRPSADEVDCARRVVAAFDKDSGSIVVDGRMVDLPVVEGARQTLALHDRRTIETP
jgi:citrate lyase subunit beta / citryl-CoA lyase